MIPLSEPKGGQYTTVCVEDENYEPLKTDPQYFFRLPSNEHLYDSGAVSNYPKQGTNGQLRLLESE